ncbi:MAG: SHOCT domain-containing protein [Clostridia bacterium]|nr:SHOCT domain-containing protein [Clostridia bacterium]
MGREFTIHGQVISGAYKGCNVYKWDDNSYVIISGIMKKGLFASYSEQARISRSTVKSFRLISQQKEKENQYSGVITGLSVISVLAGGGAFGSANHEVEFEFVNGYKSTIVFKFDAAFNDIKKILSGKELSNGSSGTSAADELIKYKQLLDMGAITQEEYNLKKKQIIGI